MNKIRLLLRSVYLKGHQDALTKSADMSWEDKIVQGIQDIILQNYPKDQCDDFGRPFGAYNKGLYDGKEYIKKIFGGLKDE